MKDTILFTVTQTSVVLVLKKQVKKSEERRIELSRRVYAGW